MKFNIRMASKEEIPKLVDFQMESLHGIPDDFFGKSTFDYLQSNWDKGLILMALDENQSIAAFGVLTFDFEGNSEAIAKLCDFEKDRTRMACLDGCVVHPKYRGNGIQLTLMQTRINLARDKGYSFVHIACNPHNVHSLRNIKTCGFGSPVEGTNKEGTNLYYYVKSINTRDFTSSEGVRN